MMNPTPVQLASGNMSPVLADQCIIYQQQPEMKHSQSWQHQQNVDQNQREIYYQQQQMSSRHQYLQMSSQQQLQPTQVLLEHQQEVLNYQLPQRLPLQLQLGQQQHTQDKIRTLWIGGLQHWMHEAYIYSCFSYDFLVCSISLIQNKLIGYSEGYCYVEFTSQAEAERALHKFSSLLMPQTQCHPFRLQWASLSERQISFRPKASPKNSIHDVNLALGGVSEHSLLQEKPQEVPELSLWEGDLALGFITEPGVLQEKPKEGPIHSPSDDILAPAVIDISIPKEAFRTPHPSTKQELVKVSIPGCSTWGGVPGMHPCPWH